MLTDFIIIDKNINTPVYLQIYNTFKHSIETGKLKENDKLPSIRKVCSSISVSKTTVENAYNRLCMDGYIVNKPQKGYFVEKGIYVNNKKDISSDIVSEKTADIKYDFSGKGIDNNCSNIKVWKKFVRDILNNEQYLNTYSENQGELSLRKAIEKYSYNVRGVNTSYNNIIIGSGSQTLIYILCGLIGINKTIAIEKNTYPQAEQVFRDFNYNIRYTENDDKGISVDSLNKIKPDVLLVNPNTPGSNELSMPISKKLEIINWAKENNCLIIEDDYNGELRYKTHPTASMQSYDNEHIIYIGSFSKILLPSVRISYMALPDSLISKYNDVKNNYNQTSSKTEQLALAKYINEGMLEKHLRKARRYYKAKSNYMIQAAKKYFDNVEFFETSMYIKISSDIDNPVQCCEKHAIGIMNTSIKGYINLSFSHIDKEIIEEGLIQLKNILI